jgi:hypothetical protein
MKKLALTGMVLGAAMVAGIAQAEPLTLTNSQMDQVSAGSYYRGYHRTASAYSDAWADAVGHKYADASTYTSAFASVIPLPYASAYSSSYAYAQ